MNSIPDHFAAGRSYSSHQQTVSTICDTDRDNTRTNATSKLLVTSNYGAQPRTDCKLAENTVCWFLSCIFTFIDVYLAACLYRSF